MQSPYSAPLVKGVIISCRGDIDVLGADKFVPVDVPVFDPVFAAELSATSSMLGVPLRVRKLPPHPAWGDSHVGLNYENQEVKGLFRAMDPEQDDFGCTLETWVLDVGSVLIVRDDHTNVTPQQVEALCYYSLEHTRKMFDKAVIDWAFTDSNEEMVKVAALFAPDKFREFFAEFKAKKMAGWATAVSPV